MVGVVVVYGDDVVVWILYVCEVVDYFVYIGFFVVVRYDD